MPGPIVVCLFGALIPPSSPAQQPIPVSGEVTCADCVITLDTVATIGGREDFGLNVITPFSQVAVDRRGRVLITHLSYPGISIFDLDGDFLGTVGREGDRPGEYDGIAHVNVGPRFVHVFEFHRGRTMLDLGFEVARTDRSLGQVLSSVVFGPDEVAFAVPVPEPASVGHQLRILDARGRITSFGGEDPVAAAGPPPHRFVVAGDDETFWAVRQQVNRVVRWNLEPEPVVARVFDRTVEVFEQDNPSEQLWPRALNVGAMLDDDGLWIAWQTPDPGWPERISPGGEIPEVPWQTVLDGWLDLIDPSTGQTLARYHGDDALLGFAHGSRYVVSYHEPNAGGAYIRLLEPRCLGGNRRKPRGTRGCGPLHSGQAVGGGQGGSHSGMPTALAFDHLPLRSPSSSLSNTDSEASGGPPRGGLGSGRECGCQPTLPHRIGKHGVRQNGTPRLSRRADFSDHAPAIRNENGLPTSRQPQVLPQSAVQRADSDGSHETNVATWST